MIIGAGLDARLGLPLEELRDVGREAARLGFESLWTPAGGVPDAFHVCAAWSDAARTPSGDSLRTGIAVVPAPRMWNPASLAAQAATVGIVSRGQFVLGIGSGGAGARHFEALGMPNRPIAVMRDYLTILRALLAGEEVTYEGPALRIEHFRLGGTFPNVPVYLAALGPQMLQLAGAASDGASLNWATPEQIAWSREQMLLGAKSVGRDPSELTVSMYIRVCIDDDVEAARRAFGAQVLGYALARPGSDPTLAYRGHFGRMGFDAELRELETRRDAGAKIDELVGHIPEELLQAVGYYGPAAGAAERFASLSEGLDETLVRVITARPGPAPVIEALEALTPANIRAAGGAREMGTTVGIIHPGEMGAAIGASLVSAGHEVLWAGEGRSAATTSRAERGGLADVGTIAALVERVPILISVCPPHAAVEIAELASGFGGLFVDANAISPATAGEVCAIVERGGAHYVDGGIIGAPPGGRQQTRLYLSGDRAGEIAELFPPEQVLVQVISERPTAASALKMSYAAWTKGTAALLLDILALARAEGVDGDLLAEWTATSPELLERSQRAAQSAATKGWRWIGEMEEIAASFRTVGLPDGFHLGAAEIFRRSPREDRAAVDDATVDQVVRALNGAGPLG